MKTAHSRPFVIQTYAEAQAFNAGVEAMRAASLKALNDHRIELTALIGVLAKEGDGSQSVRLLTAAVALNNAVAMIDDLTVAAVGDVA